MIFLFKKSKLILDCFTYDPMVAKTASIQSALKFYPDWIRKIPSERFEEKHLPGTNATHKIPTGTIKGCPGVIDYFKTGVMAPLWTDVSIAINPNGTYTYSSADSPFSLESHWPGQWDGFNGYQHIKMVFPWHIEESTGTKFLLQKPLWTSNDNPFLISKFASAGGVIDFKSQHCLHMHVLAEIPLVRQEFILNLGTPLIHLIPLSDKEIEVRTHIVDDNEWHKRTVVSTGAKTFIKQSLKRDQMIKSVEGCPFK